MSLANGGFASFVDNLLEKPCHHLIDDVVTRFAAYPPVGQTLQNTGTNYYKSQIEPYMSYKNVEQVDSVFPKLTFLFCIRVVTIGRPGCSKSIPMTSTLYSLSNYAHSFNYHGTGRHLHGNPE